MLHDSSERWVPLSNAPAFAPNPMNIFYRLTQAYAWIYAEHNTFVPILSAANATQTFILPRENLLTEISPVDKMLN